MSELRRAARAVVAILTVVLAGRAGTQSPCAAPCMPPDPAGGWCDVAGSGPDGIPGTGDENPNCTARAVAPLTDCGTHQAYEWSFDEGEPCEDCRYVFYVSCGGGLELALRLRGAEGMVVSMQAVDGSCTALPLVAENECAPRTSAMDPLLYCDGCTEVSSLLRKDRPYDDGLWTKPEDSCSIFGPFGPIALPEQACLPVSIAGTTVAWGRPDPDLDGVADEDEDGDGVIDMDPPPCTDCTPSSSPLCPCGASTRINRVSHAQDFVVRYAASPPVPLHGVYRVEIRSGSGAWSLIANGGGTTPAHMISDSCALATASLPPALPELTLLRSAPPEVVDATGCPGSVVLRVTICNEGAAAAASSPFEVRELPGGIPYNGDNSAHPTDPACVGPLAPGECRTCDWPIALSGSPDTELLVSVDRNFVIDECGEATGGGTCGSGYETWRLCPCGGAACAPAPCSVTARASAPSVACAGDVVRIDASASIASGCAGALEYRYESPAGTVLPGGDWSSSRTHDWTASGSGMQQLFSRVRCAATPGCAGLSAPASVDVVTSATLAFPSALVVTPEGDCALRVAWDPATGAAAIAYDVYRSDALPVPLDAAHRVASGLTTTTLLDASGWGAWSYRVAASAACASPVPNGGGDSAPASPVDLTPPLFGGIVDTRDLGRCQVEVSWDEATARDGCSGVASYDVYRDNGVAHAGRTLVASGIAGSPYIDTTPGNGTWVYVVRAVDAAGNEEQNDVFQQESEGSCTNDFPRDAGLGRGGMDPPNADRGHAAPRAGGGRVVDPLVLRRALSHQEIMIRWEPSPDEGGLYPVTYAVMRGSIDAVRSGGYSHAMADAAACGITAHEYALPGQIDGRAWYYLVAAVSGDNSTFGYDSLGQEIPAAAACE